MSRPDAPEPEAPAALPPALSVPPPLAPPPALPAPDGLPTPLAAAVPALAGDLGPATHERPRTPTPAPPLLRLVRPAPAAAQSSGADARAAAACGTGAAGANRGRRFRVMAAVLAAALVGLTALGPLAADDRESSATPDLASVRPEAVGMPIPVGDAPVRPLRVIVSVGPPGLAPRELRALGSWMTQTQHAGTRVRVRSSIHLSRPLAGTGLVRLADAVVSGGHATTELLSAHRGTADRRAMHWLQAAALRRAAALHVGVGRAAPIARIPRSPWLRTATVESRTADRRVHRRVAARIARQIMLSARQGYGGLTEVEHRPEEAIHPEG